LWTVTCWGVNFGAIHVLKGWPDPLIEPGTMPDGDTIYNLRSKHP
jgi:hypothetical protein